MDTEFALGKSQWIVRLLANFLGTTSKKERKKERKGNVRLCMVFLGAAKFSSRIRSFAVTCIRFSAEM
jgi:hypothetical protein